MIILRFIEICIIFAGIFLAFQLQTFLFFRKNVIGGLEKILNGRLKFNLFFLKLNGNWSGKKVNLTILPPNVKTAPGGIGEGELTIKYSSQSPFKLEIEKRKQPFIFNKTNDLLKDIDKEFMSRYSIHTDNYELTNRFLSSSDTQQAIFALLDIYNFKVIKILPDKICVKKKLYSNFDVAESKILSDLKVLEQISSSIREISAFSAEIAK